MTLKRCSKCRRQKEVGEFHKNVNNSDGYGAYCKECMSIYGKKYFAEHRRGKWDKYREVQKLKQFLNKYEKVGKDIDDFVGKKDACRDILLNFVRSGRIRRPTRCEDCGEKCKPDGHHIDYSKPLLVIWLCEPCHWKQHPKKVMSDT